MNVREIKTTYEQKTLSLGASFHLLTQDVVFPSDLDDDSKWILWPWKIDHSYNVGPSSKMVYKPH